MYVACTCGGNDNHSWQKAWTRGWKQKGGWTTLELNPMLWSKHATKDVIHWMKMKEVCLPHCNKHIVCVLPHNNIISFFMYILVDVFMNCSFYIVATHMPTLRGLELSNVSQMVHLPFLGCTLFLYIIVSIYIYFLFLWIRGWKRMKDASGWRLCVLKKKVTWLHSVKFS